MKFMSTSVKCVVALVVALLAFIGPAAAIEEECKACRAVGVSAARARRDFGSPPAREPVPLSERCFREGC